MTGSGTDTGWHRLHPLSPVVRSGRGLLAVLALIGVSASGGFTRTSGARFYDLAVPAVAAVAAVINWLVTRWRVDGTTLRIETGLLRRDSRQLPVARIQAVDLVRPFLARALGLAELRVRLAGSSHADGRLAYLPEQAAAELRARLLATHYGLDPATPEPAELVIATVPPGRLLGSVVLSSASLLLVVLIGEAVLAVTAPAMLAVVGGTLLWWLITTVPLLWRRVSAEYGFTVAGSPDGIRIRRGLLSTVAETIPVRRVQAVRLIEPLLWRPLGWCRLEVDVAGSPGRDHADGSGRLRKTLLPVGPAGAAAELLRAILGENRPEPVRPSARARWKAPLSYHFLAAGHDAVLAVARTGRVRRETTWVPLEKVQSVRYVQGPWQRRLELATVHVDAAGRRVRAEFRDRPASQARQLVDDLAALSRSARARVSAADSTAPAAPAVPARPAVPGAPAAPAVPATPPVPGVRSGPATAPLASVPGAAGSPPEPGVLSAPGVPPGLGISPGRGVSPAPGIPPGLGVPPEPGVSPGRGVSPAPDIPPGLGVPPEPDVPPAPGVLPASGVLPALGVPPESDPPSPSDPGAQAASSPSPRNAAQSDA